MAARDYGQYCGVTRALELIGERWALLIIRDLLVGPRRYGELADGLPRIPSNILAARLKELQEAGILRRAPRSRVIVYELTDYGRELEPVVLGLSAWGFKSLDEPRDEQILTPDAFAVALRTAFRAERAAALPPTMYRAGLGSSELLVDVRGDALRIDRADDALPRPAVDLAFEAAPAIHRLIAGAIDVDDALAIGALRVADGQTGLVHRFAATFSLAA